MGRLASARFEHQQPAASPRFGLDSGGSQEKHAKFYRADEPPEYRQGWNECRSYDHLRYVLRRARGMAQAFAGKAARKHCPQDQHHCRRSRSAAY